MGFLGIFYLCLWHIPGALISVLYSWKHMTKTRMRGRIWVAIALIVALPFAAPIVLAYFYMHSQFKRTVDNFNRGADNVLAVFVAIRGILRDINSAEEHAPPGYSRP